MSNPLTEVRKALATRLKDDGLRAFAIIPEKVTPPFVYVAPGDPYVTYEGATFGGQIVRLSVGAVVAAGVNDKTAENLDELVLTVIDALTAAAGAGYIVGDAGQPGQININGQLHLACPVEVTTEIHRETP